MKSLIKNTQWNVMEGDNFQDSLDFFYARYLDYFPKDLTAK
ncbi:MAG: hypothetical protein AABX33_03900 [Nanoarchaeota archaeon]